MISVIQRVKTASVSINNKLYSKIDKGILVLLGVEKGDDNDKAVYLADKISELRIFEDENGKMNLSALDINAEILVVSQFTLAGSCVKGKRPSFDNAESPEKAKELYEQFVRLISDKGLKTKTGKFAAMMDVSLINDGPVTFIISK